MQEQMSYKSMVFFGGGGGYRTPDPRLMSPLLYQLSYTAKPLHPPTPGAPRRAVFP